MRINKFVALATGMSRRSADAAISDGRVTINTANAAPGSQAEASDIVTLDNQPIQLPATTVTVILNKPTGYVVSREGQGSKTIYNLLPRELHHLKPVGRLDKDSSGLILLTNDGELAQELTHPSRQKEKVYEITLNKPLTQDDKTAIETGIQLKDGKSALRLEGTDKNWTVTMSEGRNRQIRRTFSAVGYRVVTLHRTEFGDYELGTLPLAKYIIL